MITNPLAPHYFEASSEGSEWCGLCGDPEDAPQHIHEN